MLLPELHIYKYIYVPRSYFPGGCFDGTGGAFVPRQVATSCGSGVYVSSTNFDRCGREVLTSLAAATEQRLQSVADSLPVAAYDASASGSYSFTPPLPMDVGTPQKALYYDSYDFLGSVTDSLPAVTRSQRVIGLLTGERDYAATTAKTLTTAYGYNAEGRVAEKSEQTINGTVHTAYTYDRRGNVLTERSVHTPRGQAPIVREVTTAYNAAGRVARRRVTENGSEAEMSFTYDDCGRLASERMSNGVTRRYMYNIHGWPELTETVVPVELQADKDSVVQILPPLSPSYYRRIIGGIDSEDFTVTYSYDELSRPTDVDRSGVVSVDADGVETFGMLDELTYRYGESGALESIEGEHEGDEYYGRPGYPATDGTYTWNNAGCMKSDSSRGISNITYNYRNLPSTVEFEDGSRLQHYYNAEGVLLRSIVRRRGTGVGLIGSTMKTVSSRDYIADRVFNKGKLEYSYFPGGYFDGTGGVHYLHSDYQGSVVMVTDSAGRVEQHNTYYPYGEPHRLPSGQRRLYCGKERESVTGEYDYGARQHFAPGLLWTVPDALADKTPDVSPYVFCNANPVRNIDPDGNTPTVLTGVLGAAIGSLAYMTIEFTIQLMSDEKMDWKAVGGAGARGAIVGSVTGLTLGAGTATAVAATASANVVGGIADRAIQGEETTATDVAVDAAVGAGSAALGSVAGNATKKTLDKASRRVKGKIGEAVTHLKYNARGYISKGKYSVPTGALRKNGGDRVAEYDFQFKHLVTGKRIVRESKFNKSGLTPNQKAAWNRSEYPIEIDRTTSDDIGRWVQSTTMLAPALTPAK